MDHDKDYDNVLRAFLGVLNGKWLQGDSCISFKPSKSSQIWGVDMGLNPPKMAPSVNDKNPEENVQKVVDSEEP